MKLKSTFALCLALITTLSLMSCEKDALVSTDNSGLSGHDLELRNNGKGKGKKDKDGEEEEEEEEIVYTSTFILRQAVDFDPLYKFSISEAGDLMLLQTNPEITTWGTDYWGSWSDPYPYANYIVHYTKGLTDVTYVFDPLPDGSFDVTKTLIVSPYSTRGEPDTTITNPGIYVLME